MGTRTVRLDDESERMLADLRRAKGLSVSAALKRGLVALRDALDAEAPSASPYSIYRTLDLGPGGYAPGKARRAKAEISRVLRKKTAR